ncbi:hypothetical protein [Polyangium fumosum]|uniref:Uncharacterized protein n=1 Tax=Polyangium fumosum TaxID=889272 RepID=A0A4V5PKQ2_9BACT|nr:hypothetical protein [Polyangium fumosum]TKC96469.1 hypothetical protein E8A74_45260 [Polyangium fumosum]
MIIAAAALMLGARVTDENDSLFDHCEDNLGYVFEGCREWDFCPNVDEDFLDACVAGCVLGFCPKQDECTGLDPMFCAPCDDMQGALFWRNADAADSRCDDKAGFPAPTENVTAAMFDVYDACFVADVERHCPALAGTDWLARYDAARRYPRKRTIR